MRLINWILAVAALGILALGMVALKRLPARPRLRPHSALADTLPWISLETPDGKAINLHNRLAGHPAIIYVVNEAECASCSNLPLEFRVIRQDEPGITPILIASGSSIKTFSPLISQMGLTASALVDEHRELLHALSIESEPVALVVDSTGRIIYMDLRNTSQAAQYPLPRILHDLNGMLRN